MSGSKRLPLPEIREMMADGRVWCELAQVIQPDGGPHYYKDTSDGKSRVMIEVETIPGGMDLTCRLATRPTYYIPPVGALVAVLIPSGELDHCPLVVGVLDNGAADSEVSTDRTLVKSEVTYRIKAPSIELHGDNGAQVHVSSDGITRLGSGDAAEAVIKGTTRSASETTELQNLVQQFEGLALTCDTAGLPLAAGFRLVKQTFQAFLDAQAATLSQKVKTL